MLRGLAWRGLAWRGLAWRGLAWRGLAWRGLAWRGLAWRGGLCDGIMTACSGERGVACLLFCAPFDISSILGCFCIILVLT